MPDLISVLLTSRRLHEKPFGEFVRGTACEVTFGGDAAVPGFIEGVARQVSKEKRRPAG